MEDYQMRIIHAQVTGNWESLLTDESRYNRRIAVEHTGQWESLLKDEDSDNRRVAVEAIEYIKSLGGG